MAAEAPSSPTCATLARGFQNSRAGRFPQLRKPFTELFLAIQTPVLLMNVPDRKFCPIPATHALKYIAQVVANRVRRDSHKPGDVRVCEAGRNKHGDGELAGCALPLHALLLVAHRSPVWIRLACA